MKVQLRCGALLFAAILAGGPATAANIDVTSCVDTEIKLCSFNNKQVGTVGATGHYNLKQGKTVNYKCHANCYFAISNTNDNKCILDGVWVDHSWGAGSYLLVALDKSENGNYQSSDLKPGGDCKKAGQ